MLQWNNAIVESIPASGLGGPPMARALAILNTCIYDAWAAYDATALGTRFGGAICGGRPQSGPWPTRRRPSASPHTGRQLT